MSLRRQGPRTSLQTYGESPLALGGFGRPSWGASQSRPLFSGRLPLPTGTVKTAMLVLMTSSPRSQLIGQGWLLPDDVSSGLS